MVPEPVAKFEDLRQVTKTVVREQVLITISEFSSSDHNREKFRSFFEVNV